MDTSRDYTISSVQKALGILKIFDSKTQQLTLSQISGITGIGKSSVLRLLYTLTKEVFLAYDEISKNYSLGITIYRLGQIKSDSLNIRTIAKKYLQPICDQHGFVSYLGVRHEDQLIFLDRIFPCNAPIWAQLFNPLDNRELYSTGIGRLFLAHQTDEEVLEYLNRVSPSKLTDYTITDPEILMQLIRRARIKRIASNYGENEPYMHSICAPIYDWKSNMIAGISFYGPKELILGKHLEEYQKLLLQTAFSISKECGYPDNNKNCSAIAASAASANLEDDLKKLPPV